MTKTKTTTQNSLRSIPVDKRSRKSLEYGKRILKGALLVVPVLIGAAISYYVTSFIPVIVALVVGIILFMNTIVVLEWESVVIMRGGKLHRVKGAGLTFTIPLLEFVGAYVDQRMMATIFRAEKTLTADCVPVNVDAVLFWMVWDPKSACTEVVNYRDAVYWAAQTTLRDAIGSINISELSIRRKALDEEIKKALVEKTESWGITITSVEMRDIVIPEALQQAMSKEAQAERERNARVILAEAEEDISEMFVRTTKNYKDEDGAVQLRAMNMLYDGIKEKGGLVLIPSSFADAFGSQDNIFEKMSQKTK